jgi:hypothetical protein
MPSPRRNEISYYYTLELLLDFPQSTAPHRRVPGFHTRASIGSSVHILRLIGVQLIDASNIDPTRVICDDRYLQDKPVVLIIDELNDLSAPIDHDAGRMLREVFLDKPNRHLVFGSHIYSSECGSPSISLSSLVMDFSPCLEKMLATIIT